MDDIVPDVRLDESRTAHSQLLSPVSRPLGHRRKSSQSSSQQADDDSPFITPRSPPFGPSRSFLNIFRGDGSVSTNASCLGSFHLPMALDARGHPNTDTSFASITLGRRA